MQRVANGVDEGQTEGGRPQVQRWAVVRQWVMVALAAVFAVLCLALGSVESAEEDLRGALADGNVSSIEVVKGPRLDGEGREATVHWRHRLLKHHAGVFVGDDAESRYPSLDELRDQWRDLGGEVAVEQGSREYSGAVMDTVAVPGWVGGAGFLLWIATLARIVAGPQPLRFRKWGWFWLTTVPVVGLLNFWIAGDSATARRAGVVPEEERRFSGAMGFVAAMGLGLVLIFVLRWW